MKVFAFFWIFLTFAAAANYSEAACVFWLGTVFIWILTWFPSIWKKDNERKAFNLYRYMSYSILLFGFVWGFITGTELDFLASIAIGTIAVLRLIYVLLKILNIRWKKYRNREFVKPVSSKRKK